MLNPWFLLALVAAGVGFAMEAMESKEKENAKALPKPEKPKPAAPAQPGPQTIVNVSGAEKPTVEKKPKAKPKADIEASDG